MQITASPRLISIPASIAGYVVGRDDAVVRAEVIDALPLHFRLPLVLRYFHELDYEGIADVLNLGRSQVGTLLFRAKRRLRLELSGGPP